MRDLTFLLGSTSVKRKATASETPAPVPPIQGHFWRGVCAACLLFCLVVHDDTHHVYGLLCILIGHSTGQQSASTQVISPPAAPTQGTENCDPNLALREDISAYDWMDPYKMGAQQRRKPIPKEAVDLLKDSVLRQEQEKEAKRELVRGAIKQAQRTTREMQDQLDAAQALVAPAPGMSRPKRVTSELALETPPPKRGKTGPRREHADWTLVLELMLGYGMILTAAAVTDLQQKTGYSKGRLNQFQRYFKKGEIPSQKLGRPRRMSDEMRLVLQEIFATKSIYKEHTASLIQKASMLLHNRDPTKEDEQWTPFSKSTLYRESNHHPNSSDPGQTLCPGWRQ